MLGDIKMASKDYKVIGFDINEKRVNLMKKGIDPSNELAKSEFKNSDITFTHKLDELKKANFFITKPISSYGFIPYSFGSNLIESVYLNGVKQ